MDEELRLKQRVIELESALAHQQRDYETLNQVVIDTAAQLDKCQQDVQRLEVMLSGLAARMPGEAFSPEEEKPPHY